MVIKSGRENSAYILIQFVLCIAVTILFYTVAGSIIDALLLAFVPFAITARFWLATCRTIEMDEKGCTVSILWYRKKYCWGDLKVKRYADYRNSMEHRSPYLGGAEFSPKDIRKPKWIKAATYCAFAHPLSFFFVYFEPENLAEWDNWYSPVYVVDEATFKAQLKEWNVDMKEV